MTISQKSIKLLWANAAGLCAFPECRERLALAATAACKSHTIGEMAHICGDKPGSNRHDPAQLAEERDDYRNLILLCPTHHRTIDRPENEARFPVDMLHELKIAHESFVREALAEPPPTDRHAFFSEIASLLADNHHAWLSFGPLSEIAGKNPHSEAAHAVWLSERLSTIVPNNRRISEILRAGSEAFTLSDRPVIASFLLHARSYERWVADEISYEGVTRFPTAFAEMIEEAAGGGI